MSQFRRLSLLPWRLLRALFRRAFNLILSSDLSPRFLFKLQNLKFFLTGSSTRFSFQDSTFRLGAIKEGHRARYFSDPKRGLSLYRSGLANRHRGLWRTYRLDHIHFDWNDTVVDCGANYGDLWLGLEGKIDARGYVAIEPNPADFQALLLNSPEGGTYVNKALGPETGYQNFYVATEGGDSSLIEPYDWDSRVKVEVMRLDDLIDSIGLSQIKLFKLEAEGFEPEILIGAEKTLGICEYVAIDGGYERGVNRTQTFTSLSNTLICRGFQMIDVYFNWGRALFWKKSQP